MNVDVNNAEARPTHPGLAGLMSYPLVSALAERRTRRVARGVSIDAGPLSHVSNNRPEPLGALEEAILIVSLGVTGVSTHDGPLQVPGGGHELGTPFLNVVARAASSADNCQATSFFMINDEGIWLIRTPRGREALRTLRELPPRWDLWTEGDWLAAAASAKVRVSERRLEFPREYPYYLGWNKQYSNVAGTTLFLPVVDCTWQYINALLILASEPSGKRPLFVDDWRKFHPANLIEWLAKIGGVLGLSERIPYHPPGGLKWIRNGFVNKANVGPLGFGHALRTDYESFFALQNLMLVGQALGLGGWIHGSVFTPYLYLRDEPKGWHGLGFRVLEPKSVRSTPPVPASQPNPVGIDGLLEGLCPPYVKNMNEAVDRVVADKYGPDGAYGDAQTFGRPYRDPASAEEYLRRATHYTKDAITYVKEVCNYLYETYGRFPAHVDAYYFPGIWLQFSHLEMEYYDRFYDPAQYSRQAAHQAAWHGPPGH